MSGGIIKCGHCILLDTIERGYARDNNLMDPQYLGHLSSFIILRGVKITIKHVPLLYFPGFLDFMMSSMICEIKGK